MRIETGQGLSGNSTPRPRKRAARSRMTLTARTVSALGPRRKPTLHAALPLRAPVAISPRKFDLPSFRQKRRFGAAKVDQPGGIPRLIVLSARAGAGACHRVEIGCVQPPDPRWPFIRSCRPTSNRRARSRWATRCSSAAAETGPVPLDNLCFILIRQDSREF